MSEMKKRKDRFTRLFIERLRRGGETRAIKYDRRHFALIVDGGRVNCNLGNLFHYYNSFSGQKQEDFLRTQVRNWFVTQKEIPTCFDDVKADLLPKLESRAELEAEKLDGRFGKRPYHAIGEHLGLMLVYDWPDAVMWLGQGELRKWGVTFNAAIEIARQNLETLAPPVLTSPRPGLYVSRTGDSYDATRLILVELIRELPVRGSPIAIPANRDTLIITGSDDEEGLAAMAETAAEAIKQPYSIAPLAFRLDGDDWVSWSPGPEHSQHAAFKTLELDHLGNAYARQERRLKGICSKGEQEFCFPGAFWVGRNTETGVPSSLSILNQPTMPMSCPKADALSICRAPSENIQREDICVVDWDDALAILGDAVQPLETYPERYLITEFPTGTKWQRLKEVERKFLTNGVSAQHGQVKNDQGNLGESANRGVE